MITAENFTIEQKDNGNWVVKGMNYYQDVDFINGGYITTYEQAVAIRDALVADLNNAEMSRNELEQRIAELEQAVAAILGGAV